VKLRHAAALALVPLSVAMSFSLQSGRPVILTLVALAFVGAFAVMIHNQ
jgi:hypothetical protein